MYIAGREFSPDVLDRIRDAVDGRGHGPRPLTRTALAREVCQWMGWVNDLGRPCETSCILALNELERRGVIQLPAARPLSLVRRTDRPPLQYDTANLQCELAQVAEINLVRVTRRPRLLKIWVDLMNLHHPRGAPRLAGAQMRYLISSQDGYLGGLSFSAAALRLEDRDDWIGWSDGARRQRLRLVVNNSRFLIVPSVQVPNLASHVLSLAARQLPQDWQEHYGYVPMMLETFVDLRSYLGTCYLAANWKRVGSTVGRGRQDRDRQADLSAKSILVYPLRHDAREVLRAPMQLTRLLPRHSAVPDDGDESMDWAERELGRFTLSQGLRERLLTVARDMMALPQAQIPQACGGERAKIRAAYRLMDHADVTFTSIQQPHWASTEERISATPDGTVILVPQDTTSLNYSQLSEAEGLGPIGTTADGAQGMLLHSSYAVSPDGLPYGFLDATVWSRDPQAHGQPPPASAPIEDKESYRWLTHYRTVSDVQRRQRHLTLVSMGDREADIYELLAEAAEHPDGAKLLIRARHDRRVHSDEGTDRLMNALLQQPVAGFQDLQVPRRETRLARQAQMAVRYGAVTVQAPARAPAGSPELPCWGVLVQEHNAPEGVEPLQWLLLTTMPVNSLEDACERLRWYLQRWSIEVFHRTLKTGCKVEERHLEKAERLQPCLALDMIVAWRVCRLVMLGRTTPDVPCSVFFEESEWVALKVVGNGGSALPKAEPPLGEIVRELAQVGGYVPNKNKPPGTETIWRGLTSLAYMAQMWRASLAALESGALTLEYAKSKAKPIARRRARKRAPNQQRTLQ